MQRAIDSRIQAKVRILLARRWVDLNAVTVGTTNGVVYIGGALRPTGGLGTGEPPGEAAIPEESGGRWVTRIEREIAQIPEVRDVVIQTDPTLGGR